MTQENNHIVKSYDAELADLKNRTINMGEALRRQVNAVGDALLTIDEEAARRVVERDAVLNSWEVELDAYVQFLLSRRQPLAIDLRFLMGVLRISVDLERAGDEVESAAKGVRNQRGRIAETSETIWHSLVKVHALVESMTDDALELLRSPDSARAYALIRRRDVIRSEMKTLVASTAEGLKASSLEVADGLEMIRIARALERVAAHLQNVGETVVFMLEGRDIRHEHLK